MLVGGKRRGAKNAPISDPTDVDRFGSPETTPPTWSILWPNIDVTATVGDTDMGGLAVAVPTGTLNAHSMWVYRRGRWGPQSITPREEKDGWSRARMGSTSELWAQVMTRPSQAGVGHWTAAGTNPKPAASAVPQSHAAGSQTSEAPPG